MPLRRTCRIGGGCGAALMQGSAQELHCTVNVELSPSIVEPIMKPFSVRAAAALLCASAFGSGINAYAQGAMPSDTSNPAPSGSSTSSKGNAENKGDRPGSAGGTSSSRPKSVGTATSGSPGVGAMPGSTGSGASSSGTSSSGTSGNAPKTGTSGGPGVVGSPETGVPGTGGDSK
jgi:hypothetical protein